MNISLSLLLLHQTTTEIHQSECYTGRSKIEHKWERNTGACSILPSTFCLCLHQLVSHRACWGKKMPFPHAPLCQGVGHRARTPLAPALCSRARCSLHIPTPCPVLGERLPWHRASGCYESQLCKRFGPFLLCFLRGNIHIFPSVFYFKAPSLLSSVFNSKCDAFVPFLSLALIL